jgi:hypothetical protein
MAVIDPLRTLDHAPLHRQLSECSGHSSRRVGRQVIGQSRSPSFRYLVRARLLRELDVRQALPPLQYAAFYKANRMSEFMSSLIRLARETCHFADVPPPLMPAFSTGKHGAHPATPQFMGQS